MSARLAVVYFPGSNCEHDVAAAWESVGGTAELVWHTATSLGDVDAVVLPGGFAHGDYLRPGAIARFSPIMSAVARFAAEGGPVVGICNGFQVLTEAGLLPGALRRNRGLRFLCKVVECEVVSTDSVLTARARVGQILNIPINHFEGNYTCNETTLRELEDERLVVLRYRGDNPNGSVHAIAGITNRARNVVGVMPHPERASDPLLGSADGRVLLQSLLACSARELQREVAYELTPEAAHASGSTSS
ncbi:MAG TPA: phosphoribosylformylglycinamidine synthase subunit PurQ [Acidimicrobiales bacterium]|nr:phosphoribosylformylglycinamidine synthase subunit PurQ [Acidimicrobiales bacterium]